MEDYETRLLAGKQLVIDLINNSINNSFEQALILWKEGYSTRIIQEITGIHRSKLSRYVNEHNLTRDDDKRSQNRKNRVYQCQKLHKMDFSREEIAHEMGINPRTVDSYFKEIGVKNKTKMKELR